MSPTVWITGAAGWTGGHLAAYLEGLPDRPRIVGLDVVDHAPAGVDIFHRVDLGQSGVIPALAREECPDYVIHLAAAMPPADELLMWRANVTGTMGLLQGLHAAGCRHTRTVSLGSAAEYAPQSGDALDESSPCASTTPYGRTKEAQTNVALGLGRQLGLHVLVARPFNLIGPGLSTHLVAGWLCRQFADGIDELTIGNTRSARDFIDVRDAATAYWLLARHGIAGEIYNVCTGLSHTVDQLLATLRELTGRSPRVKVDPGRLRETDPSICRGDFAKLHQATGWQPRIGLAESLAAMLAERERS